MYAHFGYKFVQSPAGSFKLFPFPRPRAAKHAQSALQSADL